MSTHIDGSADIVANKTRQFSAEEVDRLRRNPPELLEPPEAAIYIRVSQRKLRSDTRSRLLPHLKLGGKILYRRSALDRALQRLEIASV